MLDPNLAYKCPFSSFIASRTVSSSFLCASTSFVCVSTAFWSCVSADFWEVWTKHSPRTSWHVSSDSSRNAISPSASSASSRRFCCCCCCCFGRRFLVVFWSLLFDVSRESNVMMRRKERAKWENRIENWKTKNDDQTPRVLLLLIIIKRGGGVLLPLSRTPGTGARALCQSDDRTRISFAGLPM